MARVERSRNIPFDYESRVKDIGKYRRVFSIKRLTPGLQIDITRVKSQLMGGEIPVKASDALFLEMIAYIAVLCDPVWEAGEKQNDSWLDDEFLNDIGMVRGLYEKIVEYNNSFFTGGEHEDSGQDEK